MSQSIVFHLDDFRVGLTSDAFRVFALLDELELLSDDFKHALAQCCASAPPSTIWPEDVIRLLVQDGICQMFGDPANRGNLRNLLG